MLPVVFVHCLTVIDKIGELLPHERGGTHSAGQGMNELNHKQTCGDSDMEHKGKKKKKKKRKATTTVNPWPILDVAPGFTWSPPPPGAILSPL